MTTDGSAARRIMSASGASWARIAFTVFAQLALVPLYLSAWGSETYGAWLLLQTVWGTITIIDLGHQDYVGNECLRLGATERGAIGSVIGSALPMALLIAIFELGLIWGLTGINDMSGWLHISESLYEQWTVALLVQAATWLISGSGVALLVRAASPFGYFPRVAWWSLFYAVTTAAVPGLTVWLAGADLLEASIVSCVVSAACNLLCFLDLNRRLDLLGLLKEGRPSRARSFRQLRNSLWLTANGLVGLIRQQGARLVLAPLTGVAQMAAFSTMRTGANFALQGLNTVTTPIMPELMRFLVARDQARTEGAFAVIWLVVCAILSPAIVVLQLGMPTLFPIWTHGKMAFDPWLFAMLSLAVAVYALAQPATATLVGNNRVQAVFGVGAISALAATGGMILLIPVLGIRGAAGALLAAEIVSMVLFVIQARWWFHAHGMRWPMRPFLITLASVFAATLGMGMVIVTSGSTAGLGVAIVLLVQAGIVHRYWRELPPLVRQRVFDFCGRYVPALRRMR